MSDKSHNAKNDFNKEQTSCENTLRLKLLKEVFNPNLPDGTIDADKVDEIIADLEKICPMNDNPAEDSRIKKNLYCMLEQYNKKLLEQQISENAVTNYKNMRIQKRRRYMRFTYRFATFIFVLVIVATSVHAFGIINIFQLFFDDNSNKVNIVTTNNYHSDIEYDLSIAPRNFIDESYEKAIKSFKEFKIPPMLPQYLPDGIKIGDVSVISLEGIFDELRFDYHLEAGEIVGYYSLKYVESISDSNQSITIDKEAELIEIIELNGIEFMKFYDGAGYLVMWVNENAIYKMFLNIDENSIDEMIKTIK